MSLHKTPTEALSCLQSGHRVFIHGGAATPFKLLEGLIGNAKRIRGVELIHIHTEGKAD